VWFYRNKDKFFTLKLQPLFLYKTAMRYSFIIIDANPEFANEMRTLVEKFPKFLCAGILNTDEDYIASIYKIKPQLVFVSLPFDETNVLNFTTITELHQYAETFPYFIALAKDPQFAFEAIQSGFSDYLLPPYNVYKTGLSLFKFEKRNPIITESTICVKSYSDYQFIVLQDILYLKADNNCTDIKLINGKIISAYKTLKFFENSLPFYFFRIHQSYIVNVKYVSRVQVSKSKCHMRYEEILPYSNTYKNNIDAILRSSNI
jgi:DNA-binding LytR/AlgR family response regulator